MSSASEAKCVHMVKLFCKDEENGKKCFDALTQYARANAVSCNVVSYDFGFVVGSKKDIYIVERWNKWEDLDKLLTDHVVPALPMYNEMLQDPFDPATCTIRVELP